MTTCLFWRSGTIIAFNRWTFLEWKTLLC